MMPLTVLSVLSSSSIQNNNLRKRKSMKTNNSKNGGKIQIVKTKKNLFTFCLLSSFLINSSS